MSALAADTKALGLNRRSGIRVQWEAHLRASFPADCSGHEIAGVDLVALDADAAGCLAQFFASGQLDVAHTAMLGRCYRDLTLVRQHLSGEARGYFTRLEALTAHTLEALSSGAHEA